MPRTFVTCTYIVTVDLLRTVRTPPSLQRTTADILSLDGKIADMRAQLHSMEEAKKDKETGLARIEQLSSECVAQDEGLREERQYWAEMELLLSRKLGTAGTTGIMRATTTTATAATTTNPITTTVRATTTTIATTTAAPVSSAAAQASPDDHSAAASAVCHSAAAGQDRPEP